MGVAAAMAARSMRLRVGAAASVAANVQARPELVTILIEQESEKMLISKKH